MNRRFYLLWGQCDAYAEATSSQIGYPSVEFGRPGLKSYGGTSPDVKHFAER